MNWRDNAEISSRFKSVKEVYEPFIQPKVQQHFGETLALLMDVAYRQGTIDANKETIAQLKSDLTKGG